MPERILLSSPDVGLIEEESLISAFRSGWIAPLGPQVNELEAQLAKLSGREHAVALSSGTAALHLALLGHDVGRDDVVLTSSMTFIATANAIVYTGARPVFVDSGADGNMDPELLATAITQERRRGSRIKAILPVDLLGKVADYEAIGALGARFEIPVIADAAESLGGVRAGRPAGSFGSAAAVSFNGNKIITTSGGGALLTDDAALAERSRYLATQARQPVVHYEHTDIGYNYRLSNLLAGLGLAQLSRLDEMLRKRANLRARYREFFADVDGATVFGSPDGVASDGAMDQAGHDNCWLTSIEVDPESAGWTSRELMAFLDQRSIESRPLWKPMHLQPVFASDTAYVNGVSERLFQQGLSLPSSSALTEPQLDRIFTALAEFLKRTA